MFRVLHFRLGVLALALALPVVAPAQIDPVRRELVQLGYNQALQGRAPFSGYAFYYRNQPEFVRSNLTLRLAVAPVYLDSELGIRSAVGPHTDLGVGLAGGGFADSYNEIRAGRFLPEESFLGHGGEVSASVYHLFNDGDRIPLSGLLRVGAHYSAFSADSDTADAFRVPDDNTSLHTRVGLRWGGREPVMLPEMALELSVWYAFQARSESGPYGFDADRRLEARTHLFWGRALFAYTLPESEHNFSLGVTAGYSLEADRLSAFRLGALLPLVSEFALTLPGYYYQELSAERFVLATGTYSLPLDAQKRWNLALVGSTAWVDYLPGLEQPGHWHSGVGGGLLYRSSPWQMVLGYAYGVDALRSGRSGAHSIGVLVQIDLERTKAALLSPQSPFRSRGLFRLFGGS